MLLRTSFGITIELYVTADGNSMGLPWGLHAAVMRLPVALRSEDLRHVYCYRHSVSPAEEYHRGTARHDANPDISIPPATGHTNPNGIP